MNVQIKNRVYYIINLLSIIKKALEILFINQRPGGGNMENIIIAAITIITTTITSLILSDVLLIFSPVVYQAELDFIKEAIS